MLSAKARAKLLHYADQDRKDARYFAEIGNETVAQTYRERAAALEQKANAR